jgi:hypothetical protein
MKNAAPWTLATTVAFALVVACSSTGQPATPSSAALSTSEAPQLAPSSSTGTRNSEETSTMKIRVAIGQKTLQATLLDNATARDFASLLPLTIRMNDLAGKEKYGRLPRALASGRGQSTHEVGDFGYWAAGPDIAVYYQDGESIPSPGIVMIGKVDGLGDALTQNNGAIDITFSAEN